MVNSPIGYFGGKFYILKYIYPLPYHKTYIDVFGGSGIVLIKKPKSYIEIYNDINSQLVNFFRVLQNYTMELKFLCEYKGALMHRDLFDKYKEPTTDPIENAFRFFYINRFSFGNKMLTYQGITRNSRVNHPQQYRNKIDQFERIHDRIKDVQFENKDFRNIISRFDNDDSLFFCDPPYFKSGTEYEKMEGNDSQWKSTDYDDLIHLLGKIKGKFILTTDCNDLYGNKWFIHPISMYNYTNIHNQNINQYKPNFRQEYIIRNFDPNKIVKQPIKNQMTFTNLVKK